MHDSCNPQAYRIRLPRGYIFQKGFLGEFQFINPSKSGVLFEKKFQKHDFSHYQWGSIKEWGYKYELKFLLRAKNLFFP